MTLLRHITLAVGISSMTAACGDPESEEELAPSFEEFFAKSFVLPDGRIVADEDIIFGSEEEVRDYYDDQLDASAAKLGGEGDGQSHRSSVRVVAGQDDKWSGAQNMHLTYCINTLSFGPFATELTTALNNAMDSWSSRVGVVFERKNVTSCNNANSSVVFNVRSSTGPFYAAAFFPSTARSERELLVTADAFSTDSGGRDLEGILRHELGHAIGLNHEHVWLNPLCTSEGSSQARLLTSYDVNSVMHYPQCRPSGTGGYRQTEQDYLGAFKLYGLPTAWTTTIL